MRNNQTHRNGAESKMSDTEHLLSREKSHPEAADGGQVSVRSAGGDPVSSNHTWGGGGGGQRATEQNEDGVLL